MIYSQNKLVWDSFSIIDMGHSNNISMNSVCDVKYIDIFFGFLTGAIRNFSACLSKFDVFIRNWLACFEKASFLYAGSYCISH